MPELGGSVRLDRDVDLCGLRLHLQDWPGAGGPVICLPGQTASGRSFDGLASALQPEWRVIAVDPRGRGRSGKPRHGYGYQLQVADTMALMDQLGFDRVVLVGHSFGAVIALIVAAWYPERVDALVLIDGGADIPEVVRAGVEALVRRLDTVYPSLEAYLGPLCQARWLQPWTPELEAFFAASVEPTDGGVRALTARSAVEQEIRAYWDGPPDYPALYAAVRCPTLVARATSGFFGQDDHVLPPERFQEMLRQIPDARGAEIEGANHYTILLGRPARTIQVVQEFLRAVRSGSA